MQEGIEYIHNELSLLNNGSSVTVSAMQDVSAGAMDTANAVQKQLLQTEAIQEQNQHSKQCLRKHTFQHGTILSP